MHLLHFFLVLMAQFGRPTFSDLHTVPTQDSVRIQEDFNHSCTSNLPEGWIVFSVSGRQNWDCSTFGHRGIATDNGYSNALQINGFAGAVQENENWLISPEYDLGNFRFPLLSFYSRVAFDGPRPKLLVSTDYEGDAPDAASWTVLADRFARSDKWTYSGPVNLSKYKSQPIRLALVYYSSPESGAARWTLDDWIIIDSPNPPKPILSTNLENTAYFHFGTVPAGQAGTELKTFDFVLDDSPGELTIAAEEGFGISRTQSGFTQRISYTAREAGQHNRLWIRFEPKNEGAFHGPLSFSFGDRSQEIAFLSGSTLEQDKTLDIVSWNIAWFGSNLPRQGPEDPEQQLENVRNLIMSINADIFALQEITDLHLFESLVASLEGYEAEISPAVSYGSKSYDSAQKLAFLYNTETISRISSSVLLTGVTESDLNNYPSEPDRFWASGRLPFMMRVESKVKDVTEKFSLVNIHARSNSGGESATDPRYAMRKYDVSVLKDSLDHYYGAEPLLVLGDFNDDLDQTVSDISANTVADSATSYARFMEDQNNYFSPTLRLSQAGLRSYISSEQLIDHMILSNEMAEAYIPQSARIIVPENGVANFLNNTSDHLPVKIRIDTRNLLRDELILDVQESGPKEIVIYPNPANQIVFIQLQNQHFQVSLISPNGKIVETKSGDEGLVHFDVSQLPRGVYLICVKYQANTGVFQKLIVK
ncbi:Por secretion system C-terminal sorting domain-containing protein [Cyclobacterium lianum]|uniref:Por secretion system C-terminal sorting domain-containing protein n=1 Tax=Cyclobacterium lianum TaxID=388280 RepID=A0A1M7N7X4_9BACT|nr:choice-of-anchor J domain-containing protein [Cyclobacterium lianum]SHM99713.1 Por secretion system C-terminal sorting domain-containing protein [Cyclobacterium lianum]